MRGGDRLVNECSWMSGRVSVFSIQRATVEILSARHPSSASLAGSEVPSSPAASPRGKPRTQKLLATTIQRSALLRDLRAAMSRPYWLACAFTRRHSRLSSSLQCHRTGRVREPTSSCQPCAALSGGAAALSSSSHRGRRHYSTPPGTYTPAAKSRQSAMPSSPRCCAGSEGRQYRQSQAA